MLFALIFFIDHAQKISSLAQRNSDVSLGETYRNSHNIFVDACIPSHVANHILVCRSKKKGGRINSFLYLCSMVLTILLRETKVAGPDR